MRKFYPCHWGLLFRRICVCKWECEAPNLILLHMTSWMIEWSMLLQVLNCTTSTLGFGVSYGEVLPKGPKLGKGCEDDLDWHHEMSIKYIYICEWIQWNSGLFSFLLVISTLYTHIYAMICPEGSQGFMFFVKACTDNVICSRGSKKYLVELMLGSPWKLHETTLGFSVFVHVAKWDLDTFGTWY